MSAHPLQWSRKRLGSGAIARVLVAGLLLSSAACSGSERRPNGEGPAAGGGSHPANEAGRGGGGRAATLEAEALPIQHLEEDSAVLFTLNGFLQSDSEAAAELSAQLETPPRNGTLLVSRGAIPLTTEYRPRPNFSGSDSFRFVVVSSGGERSLPRRVDLEVSPVNDAPRATDDRASTDSLTPVGVEVTRNDMDLDDAELVVTAVTQPASGTATIVSNGTILFSPRHPDSGRMTFEYTVRDAAGATDTAVVDVDVVEASAVRIAAFTAEPSQVRPGAPVTLSWTTESAERCELEPSADIGGKTSGTIEVRPSEPVRYSLVCEGPGGPATASVVVVVLGAATLDGDRDGIPDAIETLTGTDPADSDSDDDGVPDGSEDTNRNGRLDDGETDPRAPDTNEDGLCDGLREDNDGDDITPESDCLGPLLVDGSNTAERRDGVSWATAFSQPQDAADAAAPGQEIWVRVGRYRASAPNAAVLRLRDGNRVYGGFAGRETQRSARSESAGGTVLDGDFAGDDSDVPAIDAAHPAGNPGSRRTDNSEHVVLGAEDALLDGFTIEHGHAVTVGKLKGGGGLLALYPRLTLVNTNFVENSSSGLGGAILCAERCDLSVRSSSFSGNLAANGGAIHASPTLADGARSVRLELIALSANAAIESGGALDVRGGVGVVARDVSCTANLSEDRGGCLYTQDTRLELEEVRLSRNQAAQGGAAYCRNAEVYLRHAEISDNRADGLGGGVLGALSEIRIADSVFSKNSALGGGALSSAASQIELLRSRMSENSASDTGGALHSASSSVVLVEDGTLTNNAANRGGAIFTTETALTVRASELLSNSAESYGGGVFLDSTSSATFEDLAVLGNHAKSFGAGFYVDGATYSVERAVFNRNDADNTGAGIYQYRGSTGRLERVVFAQNRANFGVGMMAFGPGSLDARALAFIGNAGQGGAGLQVDGLDAAASFRVILRDAHFRLNWANLAGAAMLALSSRPVVAGATFMENVVAELGGAFLAQSADASIVNATFIANHARRGGAVGSSSNGSARVTHASFLDNEATEEGGAVFSAADSSVAVYNSVLWGNRGAGPDLLDLGGRALSDHVAATQELSGAGNLVLARDPFDLRHASPALFLNQTLLSPPTALDAGDRAVAEDSAIGFEALGFPSWSELTTAADGSHDSNDIDLGRHYFPNAVAVLSFEATAAQLSWQSVAAEQCLIFSDADANVESTVDVAAGSKAHAYPAGTLIALVCFGELGEPAVALTTVP